MRETCYSARTEALGDAVSAARGREAGCRAGFGDRYVIPAAGSRCDALVDPGPTQTRRCSERLDVGHAPISWSYVEAELASLPHHFCREACGIVQRRVCTFRQTLGRAAGQGRQRRKVCELTIRCVTTAAEAPPRKPMRLALTSRRTVGSLARSRSRVVPDGPRCRLRSERHISTRKSAASTNSPGGRSTSAGGVSSLDGSAPDTRAWTA